jgi:hypothetical protein
MQRWCKKSPLGNVVAYIQKFSFAGRSPWAIYLKLFYHEIGIRIDQELL